MSLIRDVFSIVMVRATVQAYYEYITMIYRLPEVKVAHKKALPKYSFLW